MAAKYKTSASLAVGQGVIGFGLLGVGVVGTLATVLGFFGSTWWLFDFAANFRAHLAVVLLIVALSYSLLFSKTTGLFFLAMAVINGLIVLPLYTGSPAPAAAGESLTIVSFNVNQRASLADVTLRWLETVDTDVVVLVDSTDDWIRQVELASSYQLQNGMPVDRTYGITVLAHEELTTEIIRVTNIRDVVVRVEADISGTPVAIYGIQSRPASNESDASLRDDYFAEVTQMVSRESIATVVVGDFQSTSWSHNFRNLLSEADLVDSLHGYGLQTTWPADRWTFFRMPFDHLLHSEDLTTVERSLGPILGVAHRPIVVKLARAA